VLEAGTDIQVRLEQPVSSKTARLEDRVEATVAEAVRSGSRVVIPVGSRVRGVVQPPSRPSGRPRPDGSTSALTT
jgi:type IV secretory pathway VirB10-like protein